MARPTPLRRAPVGARAPHDNVRRCRHSAGIRHIDRVIPGIGVEIQAAADPDRIFREKPPELGVVVPGPHVVELRPLVVLLPRQAEPGEAPGIDPQMAQMKNDDAEAPPRTGASASFS